VAQREVREDPAFLNDLEERQHEIAGNSEDFPRAVIFEPLQERGGEGRHLSHEYGTDHAPITTASASGVVEIMVGRSSLPILFVTRA
jgi:hypothetical protein